MQQVKNRGRNNFNRMVPAVPPRYNVRCRSLACGRGALLWLYGIVLLELLDDGVQLYF
jgi:hypothetical protein